MNSAPKSRRRVVLTPLIREKARSSAGYSRAIWRRATSEKTM
jgi:hypothetical protein